ncbi:uncharacterized protein N7482_005577 [Penicillium canariense]|uniref:Uncharacterized protein n=1 Tax=Penicillium canariense TaxID=189055 RepID=A0A9W9LN55_9EURO|nr:uncharacterized protein N7482_005577 [Penicillium canariense]KAJ5166796.1 hypothetical protein N7482_005577 [Penicillium canariense]
MPKLTNRGCIGLCILAYAPVELTANSTLFPQATETVAQSNGLSPRGVKAEPVTFVSTLAHRAPAETSSPQKQKRDDALERFGFALSNRSVSSSGYRNPPDTSAGTQRGYRSASTTIPRKRKSQSAESDGIVEKTDDSSSGNEKVTSGASKVSTSIEELVPRTSTAVDSVSVVVPAPSSYQRKHMKADYIGLCERHFPTEDGEKEKAQQRAYPTAAVNKKVVPFTIMNAAPQPKEGSLPRSSHPDSLCETPATKPQSRPHVTKFLRKKLKKKLKRVRGGPKTSFDIDDEKLAVLSANFYFVSDYRLGPGVAPVPEEFHAGCDCAGFCHPKRCSCLIEEMDSDNLIVAYDRLPSGQVVLRKDFLNRKAMISECSFRCRCSNTGDCWNHVVQRGRQIHLEVFHTGARGFGLRSPEPILAGQFIDCYLGEVITKKDADARETLHENGQSYLFSLDWLIDDDHPYEDSYVVDGQKFGSATRFINHSCNPNCKIIPVSTTRLSDQRLYYLAFFAIRDIPAETELTFDYHPNWDGSKNVDPNAVKCLCGEENCRGQLWPNTRKKGGSDW